MSVITIDGRMINYSGIGVYIKNVVPLILKNNSNMKFNILGEKEHLIKYINNMPNCNIINASSPIYSFKEQFELLSKVPENTDLLWIPHFNIPLFYSGKLIVTVHDAFHLAMPQYVGGPHKRIYSKLMFSLVNRKADSIICVSQFTKNELNRLTKKENERVFTIYNGIDKSWFNIEQKGKPHDKPYLLYVGNVKPHKNLIRLLKAFDLIQTSIPHDLIIVGKKDGFITGDKEVFERAKILGERVKFTGYIEDDLLKKYFSYADALVFPSLYEGFGLPPLEAMAAGCPVLVSNAASLPEVCGNGNVLYFNPTDVQDISKKIIMLLKDPNLSKSLREKGKIQARKFSWDRAAEETLSVIEGVLQ